MLEDKASKDDLEFLNKSKPAMKEIKQYFSDKTLNVDVVQQYSKTATKIDDL